MYWKKRLQDISISSDAKKKELSDKIVSLKEEVASLAFHNSELNDTIQSILSSEPQIATFENGKYTDDVRACVYELLSLNVGVQNVAPIIRCFRKYCSQVCPEVTFLWHYMQNDDRISCNCTGSAG